MLGIGRFDFGFLKRGLISHVNGWGVILQFDSLFKASFRWVKLVSIMIFSSIPNDCYLQLLISFCNELILFFGKVRPPCIHFSDTAIFLFAGFGSWGHFATKKEMAFNCSWIKTLCIHTTQQ